MKDFHVVVPKPVIFEVLDGEALLLHTDSGVYFSLNETGTRIWELLLEHHRVAPAKDLLVDEYEVPENVAERDVLALVEDLKAQGLIEIRSE